MEQFYAGMHSIAEGRNNERENYFTLEVGLSVNTDELVIYGSIPNKHVSLFEKQVLAFYHHAKIGEVTNDYNIFNEGGFSAGCTLRFERKEYCL